MSPRTSKDADPAYLLGRFDAWRMIRLEALGRDGAKLARAHTQMQDRFPTYDRNISYVTTMLSTVDSRPDAAATVMTFVESAARRANKTPVLTDYELSDRIGGVLYSVETFMNPKALANRQAKTLPNGVINVHRHDTLSSVPVHEHMHLVMNEYLMSDMLLGTNMLEQVVAMVDDLVKDPAEISEYSARGGFNELVAEAGAAYVFYPVSKQLPFVKAFGAFIEAHSGSKSLTRETRQQDLIAALPEKYLVPEQTINTGMTFGNTSDTDRRFAAVTSRFASDYGAALGQDVLNDVIDQVEDIPFNFGKRLQDVVAVITESSSANQLSI